MASLQGPRIAIVGVGKVGAACAYSLIHKNIASELLVLDGSEDFRDAQIEDLSDATSFGSTPRVRAGSWQECGQCDVIVFSAGINQKAGEDRLALLARNLAVMQGAFSRMRPFNKNAILLMVTNPVDVMTYFACKYSGLPTHQVIGSGNILDSTRLKHSLARLTGVAARSVNAYVVGEHGKSQTIAWSNISIGGVPLAQVLPLDEAEKHQIAEEVRNKADRLNAIKKETSWGVGACLANICSSVLLDERAVLPISHYHHDLGVCISQPVILGRRGIIETLPLPLNEQEQASMERSAAGLKDVIFATERQAESQTQVESRL